ncbi:MAG TPA: homocysteine S-methyltransferase family protein, partial [Chloroflexota bacterium]
MPDRRESRFLDELARRVLVYDGAMGTQIQAHELSAADYGGKDGCNDFLSVTRPDVIEAIHAAYLEAGVDVLETNTFQSSRLKLDEYGLGDRTDEINRAAVALARRAAARVGR